MLKINLKIDDSILTALFLSVYAIIPSYFVVSGYTVRNLLAIGFFLLTVLINRQLSIEMPKGLFLTTYIWAIGFAVCQFFHRDFRYAVQMLIIWTLVLSACCVAVRTRQAFLRVVDGLIVSGVVVALLGLFEEVSHYNVFSLFNTIDYTLNYNELRFGLLRIISFTSHAITYCLYCMMVLSLIFYRITLSVTKYKKMYIAFAGVVFLSAVFTLSRSSLLCLIACQLVLYWRAGYIKFQKKIRFGTLLAIMLVVGVIVGVLSFHEGAREAVLMVLYMFAAVFNDESVRYISGASFGGNAGGIGQRFLLYQWIWESSRDTLLLGKGRTAIFAYRYVTPMGRDAIKESIEVELLRTMYYYGFVGVLSEIIFFAGLVKNAAAKKIRSLKTNWEGPIGFGSVCLITFIFYILCMFAVMQNEDAQILFGYVVLLAAYLKYGGFHEDKRLVGHA